MHRRKGSASADRLASKPLHNRRFDQKELFHYMKSYSCAAYIPLVYGSGLAADVVLFCFIYCVNPIFGRTSSSSYDDVASRIRSRAASIGARGWLPPAVGMTPAVMVRIQQNCSINAEHGQHERQRVLARGLQRRGRTWMRSPGS